jgi:hypothetical protein
MLTICTIEIIQRKKWEEMDKVKCIILLATLYLSISHAKLIPFFAITSVCFVYEDFYKVIPQLKEKLVCGILIFVSIFTLCIKNFAIPVGIDVFPVKEVEFIKLNNLNGKILTNFGSGSYVSYKLYPNNKIFMDGRYEEVYYDYMVPMLKEFFLTNPHWHEILTYFPPDVMILENYYPIYNKLKNGNEWKAVYEGKTFGVFLPTAKANRKFIQPTDDIKYYQKTLFDTNIKF